MGTELTLPQRAAVALGTDKAEKDLRGLLVKSADIVAITNDDGYKQCHASRMVLKNARLAIQKTGKTAREDAQAFAKAVITEENRLVGIVEGEEMRLGVLQDGWEAAIEAERQAKAKAEAERVAAIRKRIEDIGRLPVLLAGSGASALAQALGTLNQERPADWAQELLPEASASLRAALDQLERMHVAATLAEAEKATLAAEAKRLAEEKAALERQQAEARAAEEKAKAEREAAEAAHRLKLEDEERAARQKREEEDRLAREAREAADRKAQAERDAATAKLKAEQDRLDATRRAQEEREHQARLQAEREAEEKARAERERIVAEQEAEAKRQRVAIEAREAAEREAARQAAELLDGRRHLEYFVEKFGHRPEFSQVTGDIRKHLAKLDAAKKKAA